MSQQLRTVIFSRGELEVHVRGSEVELVLYLYIVGLQEIVVQPLVELCCGSILIDYLDVSIEDRLSEVILATAGTECQQ